MPTASKSSSVRLGIPPADLTPAKARKEAQKVAGVWEEEAKQAYLKEQEEKAVAGELPPPAPVYTFDSFVNEVWIPLCVRDGSHRPATVAMYTNILKIILPQFKGAPLAEISGVRISQYLRWLRNEYRKPDGKPLAEKSIKHHYNVLNLIFGFAEKQDIIRKNPMKKVDPPKVSKREVDALTEDEAVRFFNALLACDFEFRCILQVMKAQDAYRRKDLEALRQIHDMLIQADGDVDLGALLDMLIESAVRTETEPVRKEYMADYDLASILYPYFLHTSEEAALQEEWDRYAAESDGMLTVIENIQKSFPFSASQMLSDPAQVESYKKELEYRLYEAQKEREKIAQHIRSMLERVTVHE